MNGLETCCETALTLTERLSIEVQDCLAPFGIEVQHPDEFIDNLFDLDPAAVVAAAQKQRRSLKNPPIDVDRYLSILQRQGLVRTVKALLGLQSLL